MPLRTAWPTLTLALVALSLTPAAAWADSIAFIRDGNIWIARPDGTDTRQVTTDGVKGTDSEYRQVSAAKGSGAPRLAFDQGYAGVIQADGTGRVVLSGISGPSAFSGVDLDPVGEHLTFAYPGGSGTFSGSALNVRVDGSELTSFGSTEVLSSTFAASSTETVLADHAQPCGSSFGNTSLVRQTVGTVMPRSVNCQPGTNFSAPAVSPDGAQIAAVATPSGGTNRIVAMPIDSMTAGTPVTPADMVVYAPDWSPDGAKIAFEAEGKSVWTVPAGGGTPTKILDNAGSPGWSPYSLPTSGGGPPDGDSGALAFDLVGPRRVKAAAAGRGVSVTGSVSPKADVSVTLKLDKRSARKLGLKPGATVGKGSGSLGPGSFKLKLKLARGVGRKIGRLRRGTLTAAGSARDATGRSAKDTLKIALR